MRSKRFYSAKDRIGITKFLNLLKKSGLNVNRNTLEYLDRSGLLIPASITQPNRKTIICRLTQYKAWEDYSYQAFPPIIKYSTNQFPIAYLLISKLNISGINFLEFGKEVLILRSKKKHDSVRKYYLPKLELMTAFLEQSFPLITKQYTDLEFAYEEIEADRDGKARIDKIKKSEEERILREYQSKLTHLLHKFDLSKNDIEFWIYQVITTVPLLSQNTPLAIKIIKYFPNTKDHLGNIGIPILNVAHVLTKVMYIAFGDGRGVSTYFSSGVPKGICVICNTPFERTYKNNSQVTCGKLLCNKKNIKRNKKNNKRKSS